MQTLLVALNTLVLIAVTRGQFGEQIGLQFKAQEQVQAADEAYKASDTNAQQAQQELTNINAGNDAAVQKSAGEKVAILDQVNKNAAFNDANYVNLKEVQNADIVADSQHQFETGLQFYNNEANQDVLQYGINDAFGANAGSQTQDFASINKNQLFDANAFNNFQGFDKNFLNANYALQDNTLATDNFGASRNNFLNFADTSAFQGFGSMDNIGTVVGPFGTSFFGRK